MDRHSLSKDIVVADEKGANVAGLRNVLRTPTKHRMLTNFVMAAESSPRLDHRSICYGAVVAEPNTGFDRCESRHGYADAEFGFWAYCGQRVNTHRVPATRKMR